LIIDANAISLVLNPTGDNDFTPVWKALVEGRARAVYGGKLAEEYAKVEKLRALIRQFDSAGRFRHISAGQVDAEANKVKGEASCVSNDFHIIALARVSGVRLLCSHDRDLHADFTHPKVLQPRGSVYQKPNHAPLIRKHCQAHTRPSVPKPTNVRSRTTKPRKKR
jgi:predicted nucleic acid-binding protein